MNITRDFHTHTTYSDGHNSIEDNVQEAIRKGLKAIAITDHGYGHAFFGIKKRDIPKMRQEVDALQEKYPEIKIYLGVEANIISEDGTIDVEKKNHKELDFVIAGYHFGSKPKYFFKDLFLHGLNLFHKYTGLGKKKAIKINTNALCNAMRRYPLFILVHPGDKGPIDVLKVAQVAKEQRVHLEVNRRHKFLTVDQLKAIKGMGNKFVISSDAHHSEHIADVDECIQRLIEAGIDLRDVINLEV